MKKNKKWMSNNEINNKIVKWRGRIYIKIMCQNETNRNGGLLIFYN